MAFNLKTATPGSASASSLIFGAETQSSADPSVYNTTGSGSVVLSTSPSLTTPTLGVASATSVNKLTITAPATGSTLTILDGKTLRANNSLTLAGTDGTTMTFPSASGTVATLNVANLFTKANTFQPDSDAQAVTFRRNSSGQTANVVEIQTEANAFLAAFDKTGALTIGAASGNTGALKLAGTTSGTVTLSTADAAGTWTMKLPTSGGTNGYVLSTDGSGNTSWVAQSGGSSTLTVGSTATSGGAAGQLMFDTGSVLSESSSLVWDNTTKLLTATGLGTGGGANTGGLTVSGGALTLSGNISANAWTTSGIRHKSVAGTLTDLTSTGTVAAAYTNVYGGNTIAASNSTTYTDYFTTFITQPTAGSNVTFTNRWALGLSGNLSIASGTVTANTPALNVTQTWNNATPVMTAFKLNVTDTASNALSLVVDWRIGNTTKFYLDKNGVVGFDGAVGPKIYFYGTSATYSIGVQANELRIGAGNILTAYSGGQTGTEFFRAEYASSTTVLSLKGDTYLYRSAAATLQLGAADANPAVAQTFQVQSGSGTNINGADWSIVGSMNTGSGTPGKIIFKTGISGGSSATKATPQSAWAIDGAQALYPAATLSTSMTNGFLNIPGGAGAPSGTPANTTGFPVYWDSTNLKFYVYSGGAWKASAAFT